MKIDNKLSKIKIEFILIKLIYVLNIPNLKQIIRFVLHFDTNPISEKSTVPFFIIDDFIKKLLNLKNHLFESFNELFDVIRLISRKIDFSQFLQRKALVNYSICLCVNAGYIEKKIFIFVSLLELYHFVASFPENSNLELMLCLIMVHYQINIKMIDLLSFKSIKKI
ncbi:hypothetical protein BpHYR1_010774 [Brachionus plicatilis]|uniref:Uncharacterized protein n=1 Tax=Brachionus plicatilis TaxID=10195 RepID=A0A3M7Q5R5_BRAPC|nr:hypothetical protein BpHYR1_010774 [Brachionus plicatilis]